MSAASIRSRVLAAVNCRYGSPLGRVSWCKAGTSPKPSDIRSQRIRLDSGGYDEGGAYWGHGSPMYYVTDVGETFEFFARERSRGAAVESAMEFLAANPRGTRTL